jgi:S-formylglutathione hydrolase
VTGFTTRSEQRAFGGVQGFYTHTSERCGTMNFGVFLPKGAAEGAKVPVVYFLAGLTCTEETFVIKAGAQRIASELGIAIVTCDTSPRDARYPGDDESWDFGRGAGFYLDAVTEPWAATYQMASYVREELRLLVEREFPLRVGARGIFGHSMGGHGALTLALREEGLYKSVSAFAPIVAPSEVPWGQKAFGRYLGEDRAAWRKYDATALLEEHLFPGTILIDQGEKDQFLARELQPERFEEACKRAGQGVSLRRRDGYDHSYYFIQTFVEDHLRHHASILGAL